MLQHDQVFRLILILALAVFMPVGMYFRVKAHRSSHEKLDRRQEGAWIFWTLRPSALLAVAGLVIYLVNPAWMKWSAVPLPPWLRWVGVGAGLLAAALMFWVFRSLGTNLTDTVVTRAKHTLVTNGPYRWVRHPFYVAFSLAVVGNSLVTANWFLALTALLPFVLVMIRTSTEEAKLIERFGDDYRAYMVRTGRFLPSVGGRQDTNERP
ncbi:MAG: isoprenylcysteine carboxylmethyltransferase family protein [Planctomycetota bacterium]